MKDRRSMGERTRKNFEKHFQWHISGAAWEEVFDSLAIRDISETWGSQPDIRQIPPKPTENLDQADASQLAKWLIVNVFGRRIQAKHLL